MTLNKLLQENQSWLEQAKKRDFFDRAPDEAVKFPEEQRQRRVAELRARIDVLSRRKEETLASYDKAIELEKAELQTLEAQAPTTPTDTSAPPPAKPRAARVSKAKRT